MKARKKLDRIFALLLVFTLIFNSQATALLAMEGEPVTEIAGSESGQSSGIESEPETINNDTVVVPDGEVTEDPAGSGTQQVTQGDGFVLGEEVVSGSDSVSGQDNGSVAGQEDTGENVSENQELAAEPESKTEQPAEPEPEVGQENLSGSATEDGTGADEESGPAVDVEENSDIVIVEEETEPQTTEQGENVQALMEGETETEEEADVEVVAMGLDDEIMLTAIDDESDTVAMIGDKSFASINEAIKGANDGDTIVITTEKLKIAEHVNFNLTEKNNITLDLNGHVLQSVVNEVLDPSAKKWVAEPVKDAIITVKEKTCTIENGTIASGSTKTVVPNSAEGYNGGGIYAKDANLVLEGVRFSGANRQGNGGGAICQFGGSLTLNNVTGYANLITACTDGDSAGFLYAVDCNVVMEEVALEQQAANSKTTNSYSATYFKNCNVEMKKVSCTKGNNGNLADSNNKESIIRLDSCTNVSIEESTFENNSASGNAVIAVLGTSDVILSHCNLSGNSSGIGSIYVGNGGHLTISDTIVTGDMSSNGLYVANGGNVTMESGALYGNKKGCDVVIEAGAFVNIPAVSTMSSSIPEEVRNEYKVWVAQGVSGTNKEEGLIFEPAEELLKYKAGIVRPPEAQIVRDGTVIEPPCKTFLDAVNYSDLRAGDTIQLLPDESGTERVIDIQTAVELKTPITIDLNGQKLALSMEKSDKACIKILEKAEITVKNTMAGTTGHIAGGWKNSSSNMEEAIVVNNGTSLIVEGNVDVSGIRNSGTTKITGNAQVSQINQVQGCFELDNEIKNPVDVALNVVTSTGLANQACLMIGKNFLIDESAEIKLAVSYGGSVSTIVQTYVKKWLNDKSGSTPNPISLVKSSSDLENPADLMDKLVEKISGISNMPTVTGVTASVCIMDGEIVLFRNEGNVYLGGPDASDENTGLIKDKPVATMEKAIKAARKAAGRIILVDTVRITSGQEQNWDIPEDIIFDDDQFAVKGRSVPYAEVQAGGTLTLGKIKLDGRNTDNTVSDANDDYSKSPLICVKGGTLNITEGAILQNNSFLYQKVNLTAPDTSEGYNKNGGAVYSEGGTINMTGGMIANCKAYNGGAIYCEGGSFNMSGGTLTQNKAREAGGAVMLANGAKMILSDSALISENTATDAVIIGHDELGSIFGGDGGGIAVGGCRADSVKETPYFEMQGGRISHNKMFTCGGGIFVQANAEARIIQGTIDNNTDMGTSGNFGGGGIYVNGARGEIDRAASKPGYLYLENVLITGNVARHDVGGGIAACPTASAEIYLTGGAAIYGNKYEDKSYYRTLSDILIRRDSFKSSGTEIDVSEYMPNGQPYLWKEYNDDDDSGVGRLHRSDDMAEYNLYTEQNYKDDTKDFKVFIIDNKCYQAGGGIGANGTVEVGTKPDVVSISAKKIWMDAGRETNRPKEKIKVWLLRKVEDGEFERVAAEYLEPDKNGNWDSAMVTFPEQPKNVPGTNIPYEYKVEEADNIGPYVSAVTRDIGDNAWTITNTYTPKGSALVNATKVLTGRATELGDKEFSFSLTPVGALDTKGTAITDPNAAQTAQNTTSGAVDFVALNYTQAGTYTYKLKEASTDANGVTVDKTEYTVTVVMTDDNAGHLNPAVTYKKGEETVTGATFTNNYTAKAGTATVNATKTLTGRPKALQANEFEFSLTPVRAVGGADGKTEIEDPNKAQTGVKNDAAGKITFAALNYTQTGTYTYALRETSTGGNGVTVDGTVYTVTVTVMDDNAGQLQTSVTYDGGAGKTSTTGATFTNNYTAKAGTATVNATKTLTGRPKALQADEFEFSLTPVGAVGGADGKTEIADPNKAQTGVKNDAAGNVAFADLSYTETGTYTYALRETSTGGNGVTKDTTVYTVTVSVTDDSKGQLQTSVTYDGGAGKTSTTGATFTNNYTAKAGTATVNVTKTLTGRPKGLQANEFEFSLTPVGAVGGADGKTEIDDPNKAQTGVKNDAAGKVTFAALNYTQAGTYTYALRETSTDGNGVTVDGTVYTVTVSVTDDNAGQLQTSVAYDGGAGKTSTTGATFTNTYTAKAGTATVNATKTLTGRPNGLQANEFEFSLTPKNAKDTAGKAITDPNTAQLGVKNDAAGKIMFAALNYTQAGTYTYELRETSTGGNGVTKDTTVYTVTVSVTDDSKGQLQTSVAYDGGAGKTSTTGATFTNTYTAKAGTATVNATKTLTGRPNGLQANEFEFSLTPVSAVGGADGATAITDPNAEQTGVKNDAAGKITFAALNYTETGTYTYELRETSTGGNGVTVDGTVYTVTVTVTDDSKGQLQTSVAYDGGAGKTSTTGATFTNTYTAKAGTATVSATKTLNGRPNGLQANEFEFSLTPVGAVGGADGKTEIDDPNARQTGVKNDAAGKITFAALNYTQAGTYTYELKETSADGNGVTVDGTVYTVTVTVTDNNAGQLQTSVAYDGGAGKTSTTGATFTNNYTAKAGTATVNATKTLTGRPNGLQANEFEFSLTPVGAVGGADGKTEIEDPNKAQTGVKNDAAGNVAFANLSYTETGTYTYELKETSANKNGVTVDGTVYTVTVTVTDDNAGQLQTSVAYRNGTKAVEARDVVFTNTYKAAAGKAQVTATKTLTGRADGLQDKEFSFSLTPVGAVGTDGETAIEDPNVAQTVQNDGAGKVTFADLSYTQAGTYTYEMKEAATDEAGITTDPTVYTVTVSVTDDNAGQLQTSVAYSSGTVAVDAEDVVFANTYKAADNSIRLGATKVFDRTLAGGEFTFVLQEVDQDGHAAAGGVRQEKTNGSDGKILFDEITYDKEGTYYYQISETAGSDPTVLAYDAALYTVTVTVKDEGAKLVATADLTADEVVFTNRSTKVKIDKQDADTGVSVAGAVLRIVDKDQAGAAVEQWTTDGTPHEITGKLRKNGSYTLEELSAPDGYLPTGPIDFTVNEKGETVIGGQVTDMVVMRDTKNTVSLLKLDENGKPLPGAHLVIETTDGTAVDSWVSDGTPHVARGLARGHYALSEVEAPEGYHVAEDVPFEITGAETQPIEVQMSDTKIPEKDQNKLTVMKHLHLDGISSDIGVHEAVFYVALFSDEAKTHRISDVKALTFRDSAVSMATFENLGKGTYYIGETDENGILKESEVVNDRVIYYAEYGDNAKVEFEGRKGEATGELTNVYVEIPEDISFYLSGRLTITKKVLVGGEEAVSDSTFYARIFEDAELTRANSDVIALEMNGGSKASVTVYDLPIGETLDSSATYYVAETDENGIPLDPDAVTEYQISVDRSEIVLDADHSDQEVVITNDFVEEETETETEEETDVPDAPGTAPGSGTPAPRTGDETDYLLYLLYMALSAGLFAVAAGEKRRRKGRVKK